MSVDKDKTAHGFWLFKKISSVELTRMIAENAVITVLYFALTIITQPISFGAIQFRISEILNLLCFWRPDFVIGLSLGCLLSDLASFSPWDLLFGTLATFLSDLLISYFSRKLLISCLWPVLFNGVIIGFELTWLGISPVLWINMLSVAAGEAGVVLVGYLVFRLLRKNKAFFSVIRPVRHVDWTW